MTQTEKLGLNLYQSGDTFNYEDYNENFEKLDEKVSGKLDTAEAWYVQQPIGTISIIGHNIVPLGWLLCDGSAIDAVAYPELARLYGDNLPDYRNMFLRGNAGGREIGSFQGDAIRNITGNFSSRNTNGSGAGSITNANGCINLSYRPDSSGTTTMTLHTTTKEAHLVTFDASRVVPTADENRPVNVSVNYIIKAQNVINPSSAVEVSEELNNKIENNRVEFTENLVNNTGEEIGDGGVRYIQDAGTKMAGKIYLDRNAKGLWYCKDNTSTTVNDSNYFEDYSNLENGNKLQNLYNGKLIAPIYTSPKIDYVVATKSGKTVIISFFTKGNQTLLPGEKVLSFSKEDLTTIDISRISSSDPELLYVIYKNSGDLLNAKNISVSSTPSGAYVNFAVHTT